MDKEISKIGRCIRKQLYYNRHINTYDINIIKKCIDIKK